MKMKTKTIQWMMCCLMLLIGSDAVAQKEAKKKEAQTTFAVEIMCDNCIKNIKKKNEYPYICPEIIIFAKKIRQ